MLAWLGRHRGIVSFLIILAGVILFYSLARYH
jgi:hypothetical protein